MKKLLTILFIIGLETSAQKLQITQEKTNRFGIVNRKGKTVVPFRYNGIEPFFYKNDKHLAKYFIVSSDNGFGVLNVTTKKEILPAKYTKIEQELYNFNTHLVVVEKNGLYGVFDVVQEKMIIPLNYTYIGADNGCYYVSQNEKKGLIDFQGKTIISTNNSYKDFRLINGNYESSKGLILVSDGEKYGVFNFKIQKEILPMEYSDEVYLLNEFLLMYFDPTTGKAGIFDYEQNRTILPPDFSEIELKTDKIIAKKDNAVLNYTLDGLLIVVKHSNTNIKNLK